MPKARKVYDGDAVDKLEGLEAIVKRPGMYIATTDTVGLHHLVLEILSNSIDEANNGHGQDIIIEIYKDGAISVEDFGRGIPVSMNHKYGKPALEILMCDMNSGGKFNADSNYKTSAGLHGLGTKIINALSDYTEVTVFKEGIEYMQTFSRGEKTSELQNLGKTKRANGTIVKWKPRPDIFSTTEWNFGTIKAMAKRMCYLNSKIRITIIDGRGKTERKETFHFPNGLVGMVNEMVGDQPKILSNPIRITGSAPCKLSDGRDSEYEVEIVFTYVDNSNENLVSFTNSAPTVEGGTHVQGFRTALTRVLNDTARSLDKLKAKDENLSGNEMREGLVAVVSAKVPEPLFSNQVKSKLNNPEVVGLTSGIMGEALKHWLDDNPKEASKIIDKCLLTRKVRDSMKKYKDALLNKQNKVQQLLDTTGKLSPCSGRDTLVNEIILVEGDSAGGAAKQARDAKFQAILPLRGKPLNVEGEPMATVLSNAEFKSLIVALGCGFGENYNVEKLNYNKIIFLADADPDKLNIPL